MASSSGGGRVGSAKDGVLLGGSAGGLERTLSRKVTRMPTILVDAPGEELSLEELVPTSLSSVLPILRVAEEIEEENPRVAYLCRFHAFETAHNLDPTSNGRGVRQFKTFLLHRLEKDDVETKNRLARTDMKEIQEFYRLYYDEYLRDGAKKRRPEEMRKHYQTASVLFDVLKTVVPNERLDKEVTRIANEIDRHKSHFAQYNILPLKVYGPPPPVELPEIKAALSAIRDIANLPMARARSNFDSSETTEQTSMDGDRPIHDLLDWLQLTFGFQKGSVENQRENLVLLLANIDVRNKYHEDYTFLHNGTVTYLREKIFGNYESWCHYLHKKPNIQFPYNAETQQLELLYIALYLLIWGEASNVRFMPECICYIFHNMASDLYAIVSGEPQAGETGYFSEFYGEETFLKVVIQPIYDVLHKEVQRNKDGKTSHSKWRNYDDLNEYFWSKRCFKLGWPMNLEDDFFVVPKNKDKKTKSSKDARGRRKSKTNFVEVRTFLHLFRSFYRMWTFFILAFQAMLITAWSQPWSFSAIFDPDVFRNVLSIFITAAFLNFLQAALDIILTWKAWSSMEFTQIIRYLLKFVVALAWAIIIPVSYSAFVQNPAGLIKFFRNWARNWRYQPLFSYLIVIYLIPNILGALLFMLPPLQRAIENSNSRIVTFLTWWAQPKMYVARGMHEDTCSVLKYTIFWIVLLICKMAFSYYVEISPLIEPTKTIMFLGVGTYEWHEFFPYLQYNLGVVISVWAPIVMVYFMDTQIWYSIFSTIFGGISGAFSHLGEIRTLDLLRFRFKAIPSVFREKLVPEDELSQHSSHKDEELTRKDFAIFSRTWNSFINSLREEDLISDKERSLLLVMVPSAHVSVIQWPLFLVASKIPVALNMAKDYKGKDDLDLINKIKNDQFMFHAVVECYETLQYILNRLTDESDKNVVQEICMIVNSSIDQRKLLENFRMSELPQLVNKLEKLLELLKSEQEDHGSLEMQIATLLQDTMDIITRDVMINGQGIWKDNKSRNQSRSRDHASRLKDEKQQFSKLNLQLRDDQSWIDKVARLHLLLTVKESVTYVPSNLDAKRRMTFFANSLFMTKMPPAPKVRNMMSFSVLTPYYNEDVLYSEDELNQTNDDGISILFYLQKIFPDEWDKFLKRIKFTPKGEESLKEKMEFIRLWASCRGQTLTRTVRRMMYYRDAFELQCFLDVADDHTILGGSETSSPERTSEEKDYVALACAVADIKFTYVVSCQVYGAQKASKVTRDRSCAQNILNLMLTYPSLRVAYIDEVEHTVDGVPQKMYYSVLVKGGEKYDEEVYRIKLPGPPTAIGEGKPENQNHAIIFTRGEAIQTIDMNQDNYLEEAFKMRNVLEEFVNPKYGKRPPTILGLREHIFTGSVSSLAWFMSKQETSFVTIGQRVLASPLRVRFHYGHPDIFDRIFHITRGGLSKASKVINLSEDIFAGFNSTMRGGKVTHHEYIQVGKGRDVGMNQISKFEAKVANGNGEQTLSRDVYRLGSRFDFYRMLSFYFTTVGFYFSSMVTVLTVYVFLYGRLYLVMSGLEKSILEDPRIENSKLLENALATQSVFQLGLLLVFPMVMEVGLEKGFRSAIGQFIIMQLQLAPVFFTFQLGTKTHYYGRTIMHGGAKYRPTGRGFVVYHATFASNYRMYSRSHFVKGLEMLILLVVYQVYGSSYRSSTLYLFVTYSMWFLVASWLFAPFIFNPSGFEWQKTVEDWTDWTKWMGNQGGIGISEDQSWESWWISEQAHLRTSSMRGLALEILLSLRFLIYQYGIVYHLNIARHSTSILVYGLSWVVMLTVLIVLKMVSMGRQKVGTDLQLMFRILKGLLFLGFVSVMTVLFVVCGLTVPDVFASILGFMPTGWCILLIGQACSPLLKNTVLWDSVMELGRAYEYVMGLIIFAPIAIMAWFPFVSEFQTRMLFNQAFSRGLQISRILAGRKDSGTTLD